jgi:hypothetical protein
VTKKLNGLKNKTTKAAEKMKESEQRCMVDDDISECDCEGHRADFTALRSTYQELIMSLFMTIIVLTLNRRLRPTLKVFFRYVALKKKRVGYPSQMDHLS